MFFFFFSEGFYRALQGFIGMVLDVLVQKHLSVDCRHLPEKWSFSPCNGPPYKICGLEKPS